MGKRRWTAIILWGLIFLCMPVSVRASAAAGSKATGASLPEYKTVVERKLSQENISQGLRAALEEAGRYATDEKQYKIVITPGRHRLDAAAGPSAETYYIPSNVWIYAGGATIDVSCGRMFMTAPGADALWRNIRIEGGTYRQVSDDPEIVKKMFLRLSHVRDLEIRDVKFLVKRRTHILEMGGVENVTVSGCTFSGNNVYGNDPPSDYVQPKEAVQIDVATEKAIPDDPPYDGMGSHNVVIRNNTFLNVARGVGSHNEGENGDSYTNITIQGNVFRNLTGEAIHGMHWKYATVRCNTIVNGRHAGITLSDCRRCLVSVNEIRNLKQFTGLRKEKYNYFAGIILNSKSKNNTIKNNLLSGSKAQAVFSSSAKKKNTITGNRKK